MDDEGTETTVLSENIEETAGALEIVPDEDSETGDNELKDEVLDEEADENQSNSMEIILDEKELLNVEMDVVSNRTSSADITAPPPTPRDDISDTVSEHSSRRIRFDDKTEERRDTKKYRSSEVLFKRPVVLRLEERATLVKQINLTDEEVQKAKAECIPFSGVVNIATDFIDNLIEDSVKTFKKSVDFPVVTNTDPADYYINYSKLLEPEEAMSIASFETYNIFPSTFPKWPQIKDFRRDLGLSSITRFLDNWEFQENWLYYTKFVLAQSDDCSDFYLYESEWSIPTKPYPISQATASIYFTIEVSRVKPDHCPVDVTYTYESSRLVHSGSKVTFDESWLFNIVDAKIELFKRIDF